MLAKIAVGLHMSLPATITVVAAAAVVAVVLIAALFVLALRGDSGAAAALARFPNTLSHMLAKLVGGDARRDDLPAKNRQK